MVKALAPELKMIWATSVSAESETAVVLDVPNVATSAEPFGTVFGVQLPALFHLSVVGFKFHVALPAWVGTLDRNRKAPLNSRTRRLFFDRVMSWVGCSV